MFREIYDLKKNILVIFGSSLVYKIEPRCNKGRIVKIRMEAVTLHLGIAVRHLTGVKDENYRNVNPYSWGTGQYANWAPPAYTGRFIMFSVITNIYNRKTKGPTLMELFTATGKLKKFLVF
jgi:hypothetical protein